MNINFFRVEAMIGYEILKFPWRPSRAYSSTKSRETVFCVPRGCYPSRDTTKTLLDLNREKQLHCSCISYVIHVIKNTKIHYYMFVLYQYSYLPDWYQNFTDQKLENKHPKEFSPISGGSTDVFC